MTWWFVLPKHREIAPRQRISAQIEFPVDGIATARSYRIRGNRHRPGFYARSRPRGSRQLHPALEPMGTVRGKNAVARYVTPRRTSRDSADRTRLRKRRELWLRLFWAHCPASIDSPPRSLRSSLFRRLSESAQSLAEQIRPQPHGMRTQDARDCETAFPVFAKGWCVRDARPPFSFAREIWGARSERTPRSLPVR